MRNLGYQTEPSEISVWFTFRQSRCFWQYMGINTETKQDNVWRGKTLQHTVPRGMCSSSPSSKLSNLCRRIGARGDGWLQGNSIFQTQQDWYTHQLADCSNTHQTCTGSSQTVAQHWEGEVDSGSTPNLETICNWYQRAERKKVSFSNAVSLGQNNSTTLVFLRALFCFVLLCFVFLVFCLFILRFFSKREHKVGWVGRWGRSRTITGGEIWSKYTVWKN